MILNLKIFTSLSTINILLLCISNAFKIISPYVYTASIDLTDAFFFIPIHSTHQYPKFTFYHLFEQLHVCQMDMDLL